MLRSPSIEAGSLHIRPAQGEADHARIQALVRGLSAHSRYLRFFNGIQELSQPWLERFGHANPVGDYTLLSISAQTGAVAGMAQYSANPHPGRADFAVVVADCWQRRGIGTGLVRRLVRAARRAGFQRIEGEVLSENRPMLELLQRFGFRLRRDPESALLHHASLMLPRPAPRFICNAAAAA